MAVTPMMVSTRYVDIMTVCKQHGLSPQVINIMWYARRRRKEKADAEIKAKGD